MSKEAAMTPERTRALLGQALEHCRGTHVLDDVLAGIGEGRLQLWIGRASVAVTEWLNYPRKRVLNLFLAAGDIDDMALHLPGIEAFARGGGASALMMHGRTRRPNGWDRMLGFEPCWTGHWKDLT